MSELRQRHLLTLRAVSRGDVYLSTPDYEYRRRDAAPARHVTEAVYMLEEYRMLRLTAGGTIELTTRGVEWLERRRDDFTTEETRQIIWSDPPSEMQVAML